MSEPTATAEVFTNPHVDEWVDGEVAITTHDGGDGFAEMFCFPFACLDAVVAELCRLQTERDDLRRSAAMVVHGLLDGSDRVQP